MGGLELVAMVLEVCSVRLLLWPPIHVHAGRVGRAGGDGAGGEPAAVHTLSIHTDPYAVRQVTL